MHVNFITSHSEDLVKLDNWEIKKDILKHEKQFYPDTILTEESIRVYTGTINFGKKDHDPSKRVKFYNGSKILGEIQANMLTLLSTERFSELYIRIYTTTSDEEVRARTKSIFEKIHEEKYPLWYKVEIAQKDG